MILANVKHSFPRVRKGELSVIEACSGPWKGISDEALETYGQGSHLVAIEGRVVAAAFDIKGWVRLRKDFDEDEPPIRGSGGWGGPPVVFWLKATRWAYLRSMVGTKAPVEWRWKGGMGRPLRYLSDEEAGLPSA